MTRLYLFRPLRPTADYPASPLPLVFDGVRYDYVLPNRVGIAFTRLVTTTYPFHCVDADDGPLPRGYIVQHYAANAATAHCIMRAVIEGPPLPLDVIDWIFGHGPVLDYCGGFEIAHLCPFIGRDERDTAHACANGELDDGEPDTYQPHVTRLAANQPPTEGIDR